MKNVPAFHLSNRPSQAQAPEKRPRSKRRTPLTPAGEMARAVSVLNPWISPQSDSDDPTASAPNARPRIRVSAKHHEWLDRYRVQNYSDPNGAARHVGLTRHGIGTQLVIRLSHEIAAMQLADRLNTQMELSEALQLLAQRARDDSDPKIQLQALGMVLKVQGAFTEGQLPAGDRRELMKQVEAAIADIRQHIAGGGGKVGKDLSALLQQPIDVIPTSADAAER